MDVIYNGQAISFYWRINRNASDIPEDFTKADLKVFFIGNDYAGNYDGKYYFTPIVINRNPESEEAGDYVHIDIPAETLPPGTYCVEAVWIKNRHELLNAGSTRTLTRARKDRVFKVADYEPEASDYSESDSTMESEPHKVIITSGTTSYGYDGMSAYETAVFEGSTVMSEKEWIEKYENAEDRINDEMDEDTPGTWANAELLRKKAEGQLGDTDPDYSTSREKKEADRQTAESNRASAETSRGTAETQRQKNEGQLGSGDPDYATSRIKKENDRQTAESGRVIAENGRIMAENTRVQNEGSGGPSSAGYSTSRIKKELDRQSAESSRATAETSRQEYEGQGDYSDTTEYPNTRRAKEAARQTAETARATAETARQKAEGQLGNTDPDYATSRIKQEIDRQAAEAARELAETARENAKISSTTIEYAVGDSGTTPPSSGWQSTVPSYTTGDFLWGRTTITFGDGTSKVLYAIGSVPDVAVSQNASTGKTTITVGSDSYDVATEPVSVSQNTITIGGEYAGEVSTTYDVTLHSGETFESLEDLLSDEDLATLIPTNVRKGGMTIKFVQTSDNKYVQWRLMSDSFSTAVSDWQGVDDEPTAGSNNLVKSGGVYNVTGKLNQIVAGENISKQNILLTTGGTVVFNDILVFTGVRYSFKCTTSEPSFGAFWVHSNNDLYSDGVTISSLNTVYSFTPFTNGVLRLSSISNAQTLSFELSCDGIDKADIYGDTISKTGLSMTSGGRIDIANIPLTSGIEYTIKIKDVTGTFTGIYAFSSGETFREGIAIYETNVEYKLTPHANGNLALGNAGGGQYSFSFEITATRGLIKDTEELRLHLSELDKIVFGESQVISNVTISSGGGITFGNIPVKSNIKYGIKLTQNDGNGIFKAFSVGDTYSDGVFLSLNRWVYLTPLNDGDLRVASSGAAATISFEICIAKSVDINFFDLEIEKIGSLHDGQLVLTTNGNLWTPTDPSMAATSQYSDLIPVTPGDKYYLSGLCGSVVGGAGYNENKTYNCNLWETGEGAVYSTPGGVANNLLIIVPSNVYYIRLSTKNKTNYPLSFIKIYDTLKAYTDNIHKQAKQNEKDIEEIRANSAPPIIIKKDSSTHFSVWILNRNSGKYLIYPFIHNTYTCDMSYSGGPSSVLTGDMWDPEDYKLENGDGAGISPNLNFIYMVNPSASGEGFENENLHVGMGGGESGNHGCEVREWTKLLADGKEIDLDNWTGDITCSRFRFIQKSNCYAPDASINADNYTNYPRIVNGQPLNTFSINSNNYPKILNGNPIVTAQHFLDATFEVDNKITWRNRLIIKRNHVIFEQLHGAMLACATPNFNEVIINDDKASRNHFEIVEGVPTETVVGDSNQIWNQIHQADEAIYTGDGCCVRQRTVQDDGTKFKNTYISASAYQNSTIISFKCYFQVARTTSYGMSNPDVFNVGDEISVTNERKIEIED